MTAGFNVLLAGATRLQFGHGLSTLEARTVNRLPVHRWRANLQFGHGLSTVDDAPFGAAWSTSLILQFGHGLSTVDDPATLAPTIPSVRPSIRPRPLDRG